MDELFDLETLDRLRAMPPRRAYDEVKVALYRLGPVQSEDFREAYEALVEHGILTWEQIEDFGD